MGNCVDEEANAGWWPGLLRDHAVGTGDVERPYEDALEVRGAVSRLNRRDHRTERLSRVDRHVHASWLEPPTSQRKGAPSTKTFTEVSVDGSMISMLGGSCWLAATTWIGVLARMLPDSAAESV